MHDMSHQNQFQIHKALMESYDPQSAPIIEQLVKNFYTSKFLYLEWNTISALKGIDTLSNSNIYENVVDWKNGSS